MKIKHFTLVAEWQAVVSRILCPFRTLLLEYENMTKQISKFSQVVKLVTRLYPIILYPHAFIHHDIFSINVAKKFEFTFVGSSFTPDIYNDLAVSQDLFKLGTILC